MANESQSRSARRKQLNTKKSKGRKRPSVKSIFMTLLTIGIVLMLAVGALFAYYIAKAPALDEAQLSDPFSSKIYDKDDNLITDVAGDERRTRVSYNDLPSQTVDAVLATEDVRFFDHFGIDPRRIGAAVLSNVTNGFGSEGASTITQQVVKRSYLTSDKTLERKVQEQFLAIKLDQQYSKESILEMYLNKIYYGQGAYGIVEAADTYFGKEDLNELTLPESALLAGLPQRPSGYDPYENPDLAQKRMNTVLNLMVQHNKITEEEAEEAKQTNVEDMIVEDTEEESTPYRAFIDQVEKEVSAKMDDANIYEDGLNIYTTIDPDAQEYVEQVLSDESVQWPDEDLQSGIAVTDTKSGAIRAIGGGRNYTKGNYNFATDINRQPGSTFKPITAFGPAIENEKLSTYHQINDEEIDINGWQPNNYDGEFRGWVSMRYALSRSLNIPAIKMLEETGIENAKPFVEGLGFKFEDDTMNLSDAIGGGVLTNPVQMSGAYAAFGNDGVYNEPHTVRKVESTDGQTTDLKPESKSAMSDYTAYMITSMLESVMSDGTGTAANIPGLPVAGKTGTTNRETSDGEAIVPDVWFSGYTTDYSVSIWTGYSDNNVNLSDSSQQIPRQLFKSVMGHISEGNEPEDFQRPDSVEWVDVEDGSRPAELPSDYTPESQIVSELFHVDNKPTETSEQFDKMDAVEGLSANYNEDTEAIDLEWSYEDADDVTFEVSVATDGGDARELTTTQSRSMEISQIQPGSTYEFTVVAVSDDGEAEESDPQTASVTVPGGEEESEDTEEQSDEDTEEETEEESDENSESGAEDGSNDEGESEEDTEEENNGNGNNDDNNGNNGNGDNEEESSPTEEEDTEETDESPESESGEEDTTEEEDSSEETDESEDEE
ncbi:penicillin-binding protein 1A/1B [Halobacillus andaensis]|uniref:Penicillin-binding protein 1A/1B n=1 Tax=Halobacillus andaensis TaxID=1176239 RepID=A0A917AZK9_HALAA|nr:PBP1A family penicillin-binding protein [Halobacillus andaensis]MBP2003303.1 penicillin-binding protein 1A [Halobacillus andaensis]GGF09647.1 penicillin-binding protein 1A/1B [Halobacillus andaensis]